jgi:glycosyltransferase involved in cell wall biosynthesis
LEAFHRGDDPMAGEIPLHPSFEDRVGAPDRLFASLDNRDAERQVTAWQRLFAKGGAAGAAIAHLHHLTPQHDALARVTPTMPVVAHLHGTELKMLDGIRRRRELAVRLGSDLTGIAADAAAQRVEAALTDSEHELLQSTRWEEWRHGDAWEARLQRNARRAGRLVALSPRDRDHAVRLLGVDASSVVVIPNGVDVARFDRRHVGAEARQTRWRAWLVDDPRGWDASGVAGSIRYGEEDISVFVDQETAEANPGIFFIGWRGHDELPAGLNAADVLVAPSVDEPFGLVYLEAMACGLPVVTTPTGGPLSFVNTVAGRPNGWFVDPDDETALAATLIEMVNNAPARRARGETAYEQIRAGYAWDTIATRVVSLYEDLLANTAPRNALDRG